MTNTIQLSTTHKTHDFLSRLNQEQKLEREIFEFVNSIEILLIKPMRNLIS